MKIPYMDLSVKDQTQKTAYLKAIEKVFDHGRIILGPEVQEFEKEVANYCGAKFVIGVSSGTEALYLALRGLDIGAGDEVIVPSLSWIASANCIKNVGATPVFADIRNDLNIDPQSIKKLITKKTKAIVPVHFMGRLCEMESILSLAKEYNLLVVEDAAQAFGATYGGKMAGTFGKISSFSLNPMKVLAACGEAGMVMTDDPDLYEKINILRYNGMIDKVECRYFGINGRIDTIQAAIMLIRLKQVNELIDRRIEIAHFYHQELASIVTVPKEHDGYRDVYYGYTLLMPEREKFIQFMQEKGIETKIQHAPLMPDQPAYAHYRNDSAYPEAKKIINQIINIPNHENLADDETKYIVQSVKEFLS